MMPWRGTALLEPSAATTLDSGAASISLPQASAAARTRRPPVHPTSVHTHQLRYLTNAHGRYQFTRFEKFLKMKMQKTREPLSLALGLAGNRAAVILTSEVGQDDTGPVHVAH